MASLLAALRWSEVRAGHVCGPAGGGTTICAVVEGKSDIESKETLRGADANLGGETESCLYWRCTELWMGFL